MRVSTKLEHIYAFEGWMRNACSGKDAPLLIWLALVINPVMIFYDHVNAFEAAVYNFHSGELR